MKSKEQIKEEIKELAKQLVNESDNDRLYQGAQDLFEKTILLKHTEEDMPSEAIEVAKDNNEIISPPKPTIAKTENTAEQSEMDLFSIEAEIPKSGPPVEKQVKPEPPKETMETTSAKVESLGEKLQHKKITDLKASIGINEKFQFINELFEGNMKEYNVAVDQINSFNTYEEATSYIANLEDVYKWEAENSVADAFKSLTERRFA